MIREQKRKTKYNQKKTKSQIIMEYVRTVALSVLAAVIITTFLAIHARNEMIRNIYANIEEQEQLDEKIAKEIIMQSDFAKDLKKEKYAVCMHVGELYETVHDYYNAQIAYEYAAEKAKPGIYKPFYKLASVLIAQEKFTEAQNVLTHVKDVHNKTLIKYKTRAYIEMGDKYYSIGKFLSAARSYERADFYYSKFSKKDPVIDKSIKERIVAAYTQTADIMVKSGFNSDAVRFLKKAEKYEPDNLKVKYKLAIILSDSDPEKSVSYFEELLDKIPQDIDYGVYCNALMKSATIADLDNRPTQAKYYRYKIHSVDLFVARKVVYKNDIETIIDEFKVKKFWFTYPIKAVFKFANVSNSDITNLYGDFVLTHRDKELETVTKTISNKNNPLTANGYESQPIKIKFQKNVFTKRELKRYTIKIYLYKDEKYKTLIGEIPVPNKSFKRRNS